MGSLRKKRLQLVGLILLFAGPLAVAAWLYYGDSGWRPGGSTSHGDLMRPAVPLPELELRTPDGAVFDNGALRGKWTLVYLGDGSCPEACRIALYNLRQIRLALGKDRGRVQRLCFYRGTCCDNEFFSTEHPDLLLATADGETRQRMLAVFPEFEGLAPDAAGRSYLVDPLGNLMMSYPANIDPKGTLKDLKRLLRLSHIG